jgi:hypothetical protein
MVVLCLSCVVLFCFAVAVASCFVVGCRGVLIVVLIVFNRASEIAL